MAVEKAGLDVNWKAVRVQLLYHGMPCAAGLLVVSLCFGVGRAHFFLPPPVPRTNSNQVRLHDGRLPCQAATGSRKSVKDNKDVMLFVSLPYTAG